MRHIKPNELLDNRPIESWLRDQVAPAYDRLMADPSRALTVDDVRKMLAAEHQRALLR
jgi:antitoxin ParD1/3/4